MVLTIENIGEVVGRRERINKNRKAHDGRKRRNGSSRLTRSLPRPRVFFQVGQCAHRHRGKGNACGRSDPPGRREEHLGEESASYPLYSIETIISKAPEIIIVSSMEGEKEYSNVS